MRSMMVASLPCILRCTRVPKISAILSAVSRHRPSSQLRSNSLWMGKWRLKMKLRQYSIWAIAAARQVELLAFLGGELRSEDQGPVVEPFADDVRTELVGGGLQRRDIVNGEKGIVDLAKADLRLPQLLLDETVTIEVIAGLEWEERGHPHNHRAEHRVTNVEIIVRETAALRRQDPVIGILGGVFRHADTKGGALLHALEDEIDAVGAP